MPSLMAERATERPTNSRLLAFAGALSVVMAGFHLYVSRVTSGVVDIVAILILAVAAAVVVVFLLAWRAALRLNPYSLFIFHAIAYVIIVGSIAVHAFGAESAVDRFRLTGGLVWMVAMWSVGLFVHALAANASQGFDGANP